MSCAAVQLPNNPSGEAVQLLSDARLNESWKRMDAGARYVYAPVTVVLPPPGLVPTRFAAPAAPAGTVTVMRVPSAAAEVEGAFAPPMVIVVFTLRLVP